MCCPFRCFPRRRFQIIPAGLRPGRASRRPRRSVLKHLSFRLTAVSISVTSWSLSSERSNRRQQVGAVGPGKRPGRLPTSSVSSSRTPRCIFAVGTTPNRSRGRRCVGLRASCWASSRLEREAEPSPRSHSRSTGSPSGRLPSRETATIGRGPIRTGLGSFRVHVGVHRRAKLSSVHAPPVRNGRA